MSKIQDLQDRVTKATEKVEKCKGTIARHEGQLTKKLDALVKKGIALRSWKDNGFYDLSYEDKSLVQGYEGKLDDIEGATRKLSDAEAILDNWQAKLNVAIEQERFIEGNAPQVIKDFLEQWKQLAFKWCVKRYNDYQDYSKELNENVAAAELEYWKSSPDYARYFDENGELRYRPNNYDNKKDKYLKENGGLDWASVERKKAEYAGGTVLTMCTYRNESERLAWLDKELEREKQAKLLDLVQRINAVVGSVTDAAGLRISEKGNLDGIIVGTDGTAEVHTIGAGGWNIQCWHYRTLVHKMA